GALARAVGDPQLVQPARPLLQLRPVGAAEGDVVQADPVLAEGLRGGGGPGGGGAGVPCWCRPTRVLPPSRYTVWWKSGSVSSSSTGLAPSSASYQGMLTDRSRTVTATWVMGGKSAMDAPFRMGRWG